MGVIIALLLPFTLYVSFWFEPRRGVLEVSSSTAVITACPDSDKRLFLVVLMFISDFGGGLALTFPVPFLSLFFGSESDESLLESELSDSPELLA